MTHEDAMQVAQEVQEAIKSLDHLYVTILRKENGHYFVTIKKNQL